MDIEMVKRVDKYHPRLIVIFEVLKDWDFNGESSLFYEEAAMLMTNAIVLLIESYEPLRILYTQALEEEGYIVLPACDGDEA